jgi:hypothetical protein
MLAMLGKGSVILGCAGLECDRRPIQRIEIARYQSRRVKENKGMSASPEIAEAGLPWMILQVLFVAALYRKSTPNARLTEASYS